MASSSPPIWWLLFLLLLISSTTTISNALYQDEAGASDVTWKTAGHGRVTAAAVVDQVLVTIGGAAGVDADDANYIAGRHWLTGELLWRRELLRGGKSSVYIAPSSGMIIIAQQDHRRLWGIAPATGALVWDDYQRISSSTTGSGNTAPPLKLVGDDMLQWGDRTLDIASGATIVLDAKNKKSGKSVVVLDEMAAASTDRIACQSREFAISSEGMIQVGENSVLDANELWLLKCDESGIILLSSSVRGTTAVFNGGAKENALLWTSQEGLAGASSAILVNADPALPAEASSQLLSLSERLSSQYQSLTSFAAAREEWKNHLFGWHKIALLLNNDHHRLFGLDSISGQISFQIDLNMNSDWHKIVDHPEEHHQVLILSAISNGKELHCTCLDASTGTIQNENAIALPAAIQQIIPVMNTVAATRNNNNTSCGVGAVIVLDDGSVLVTDQDRTNIPANLYSHAIIGGQSVRTYRIPATGTAQLVGTTHFPGETVVTKAYPNRHEVTESPCNVLGDNSLLLKYLNPHIMVVITVVTTAEDTKPILLQKKNQVSSKRKPAGVDGTSSAAALTDATSISKNNLFINIVDTVSGKLLYRIGHANADASSAKAIISEHWVIYTFTNTKTKKSELGVLSLYEGMIEKNGLTAFTSPAQANGHSSLDASAPVVLAKTYVLPSAPTALGMTVTRAGISASRLLLATRDGRLHSLDRHILEPRRPVGPVNENEKKEGLVQYHEMIPLVPLLTLSYNLTVENTNRIVSAATHLESQTIVLAYGGPDLFLTRTSPSKGFDVLPDSFSRPLILLVLAILGVTIVVLQKIVDQKVVQQGWV
jgi:ER membrane protein complex subunit 1, C-terminal